MNNITFKDYNSSNPLFIAGPCSIESYDQMKTLLKAPEFPEFIRGGIYKMRSNPDSFQGLGDKAIEIITELKKEFDFKFVTEISDPRQIEKLAPITDVYQVGTRNMYNYELLKELNNHDTPVILKRGFSATVKEWLGAANYLSNLGVDRILLCERGIRTFETSQRNTLDIGSIIYIKQNTNFKVIVDPSHALGIAKMVAPATRASIAAGADGAIIEVHPNPEMAMSDGMQTINIKDFLELKKSFYNS